MATNPWTGGLGWTVLIDAPLVAGVCTCTGGGLTCTATTALFNSGMVGRSIVIATIGTFTITAYTSTTIVTLGADATCTSKAFTIDVDESGSLHSVSSTHFTRDGTTSPTGAAADIDILQVTTDVWDVQVTAKTALTNVWIPWQGETPFGNGRFYLSRLCGLQVNVATAQSLSVDWVSGPVEGPTDSKWQGTGGVYSYPGDFSFPGIGYDSGTAATWIGLCEYGVSINTMYSYGRAGLRYGAMANGEVKTFRVYIAQTNTGNERARIAALVEIHGQNTPRPGIRVGENLWPEPGILEVQTQDYADPKTQCYALRAAWSERVQVFGVWGQMSAEGGTCCGYTNKLHARNLWLRDFAIEVQNDGGLFFIYTRPLDTADTPAKALEPLRCASEWCNACYVDKVGAQLVPADLPIRNLLVERYSLANAHACLVSGCQEGGDVAHSKQLTAAGTGQGTDPGESRINNSYLASVYTKSAMWLGKVFSDATGAFNSRPVKWFIGDENGDYGGGGSEIQAWARASSFAMGIGMSMRDPTNDHAALVDAVLTAWEDFGFWTQDLRFRDRIGITSIPTGVDVRRFTNADGDTILAVDQYTIGGSSVAVTVDGASKSVPMSGRLKLWVVA